MPSLTSDPKERRAYEDMLERARRDYERLEQQMADELLRAKERIAKLREEMNSSLKIYEGICERLGIENDLSPSDEDDDN